MELGKDPGFRAPTSSTSDLTSDSTGAMEVTKDDAIGRAIALKGRHALWGTRHSEEMGSVDEMTTAPKSVGFLGYSGVILTDCKICAHDDWSLMTKERVPAGSLSSSVRAKSLGKP